MRMADRVRGHTRRKPGGGTTRVQQHSRSGRPRKALVSGRHAWSLAKRAWKANKRKKKALAATLITLSIGEGVAVLTLDTAGKLLSTFAFLAFLGAGLAFTATGRER